MTNSDVPAARQTRHSRADVVAAALEILDRHGLPDLTMRRLASTLSVQPSALYWHFANKQSLLASISDQIVVRATLPTIGHDGGDCDWKTATRAGANALRNALLTFRDGAEVVSSSLALGLGAGDAHTLLRTAIGGGGFDPRTSAAAAFTLLHFILGHVSHEQQRLQADSLGVVAAEFVANPTTAPDGMTSSDDFDFGITLLLSGLELQPVRGHAFPAIRNAPAH